MIVVRLFYNCFTKKIIRICFRCSSMGYMKYLITTLSLTVFASCSHWNHNQSEPHTVGKVVLLSEKQAPASDSVAKKRVGKNVVRINKAKKMNVAVSKTSPKAKIKKQAKVEEKKEVGPALAIPKKNTITITACDNEVFLIAHRGIESYTLAHIKSGYRQKVNVVVTVEPGQYTAVETFNGVNQPIDEAYTVKIPARKYNLSLVCVNWGGPLDYAYNVNGKQFDNAKQLGVGELSTGAFIEVKNVAP